MYNETRTDLLNYLNNNKIQYKYSNDTVTVDITVTKEKQEILATIDELNQYLNGNVTKTGLKTALSDLIENLNTNSNI